MKTSPTNTLIITLTTVLFGTCSAILWNQKETSNHNKISPLSIIWGAIRPAPMSSEEIAKMHHDSKTCYEASLRTIARLDERLAETQATLDKVYADMPSLSPTQVSE